MIQALRDYQEKEDLPVRLVLKVMLAHLVVKVRRGIKVIEELKVNVVLKVQLVLLDFQGLLVQLEWIFQADQEIEESLEEQVYQDNVDHQGHKDHQVSVNSVIMQAQVMLMLLLRDLEETLKGHRVNPLSIINVTLCNQFCVH